MPIYEYKCDECSSVYEELVRLSDPSPPCPDCGNENVERLISQTSFQLKGNGWYATDYKNPQKSNGKGATEPPKKTDSGSETKSKSADD